MVSTRTRWWSHISTQQASTFNEPAGFTTLRDTPWDSTSPSGWAFEPSTRGGSVAISGGAITWTYSTDLQSGYEPGGMWYTEGQTWGPRLYTRMEGIHPSTNWDNAPGGVNKFGFWLKIGAVVNGYAFMNSSGLDLQINMQGFPEFSTGIQELQWNQADNLATPTLAQAQVNRGQSNTLEFLVDMGTPGAADGTWKSWLNGVLVHDYTGLSLTSTDNANSKIRGFQHKPIWGGPEGFNPAAAFTLAWGHTYISQSTQ